jgi:hypothetical protein
MSDPASFILEILLLSPFAVPYQLLEPGPAPACGWSFASAPYAQVADGYLEHARCAAPEGAASERTTPAAAESRLQRAPESRETAGQASLEGLAAIDGSYGRVQGRARLLTAFRLEADAAYADYVEPPGGRSQDWLGQTHVAIRFAQSERVQLRAGAGIRDRFVGDKAFLGFDALYAVDFFWPRSLATSLELSGGTLGVNGWCAEVRSTVGYVVGFVEVYTGWDAIWLGAPRERTEDLGGPVLGARAYF